MSDIFNRLLMAYRPLYMRGLLMDGQYRLPERKQEVPPRGSKVITLIPAFAPRRQRVRVVTAPAAVAVCVPATFAKAHRLVVDEPETDMPQLAS